MWLHGQAFHTCSTTSPRHMSTCGAQPAVTKLTYQLLSFFVLNYFSITASCVQPGLYDSVDVMCKDLQGNCVVMNSATRTTLRTQSHDLPMKRIAQLFNVNHFIVSQVAIVHVLPSSRLSGFSCF
jgi:hypothetical protein